MCLCLARFAGIVLTHRLPTSINQCGLRLKWEQKLNDVPWILFGDHTSISVIDSCTWARNAASITKSNYTNSLTPAGEQGSCRYEMNSGFLFHTKLLQFNHRPFSGCIHTSKEMIKWHNVQLHYCEKMLKVWANKGFRKVSCIEPKRQHHLPLTDDIINSTVYFKIYWLLRCASGRCTTWSLP